jgi:hypothetical protein
VRIMHFKSASDLRELERAERKRLGGSVLAPPTWGGRNRRDQDDDDAGKTFEQIKSRAQFVRMREKK